MKSRQCLLYPWPPNVCLGASSLQHHSLSLYEKAFGVGLEEKVAGFHPPITHPKVYSTSFRSTADMPFTSSQ